MAGVLFDAAADRLLITANVPNLVSPATFTHSVYVNTAGTTGGLQTIFSILNDDLSPYMWCGLLSNGHLYAEDNGGGAGEAGVALADNTWYCVTIGRDNTFYHFWIDGVHITTAGSSNFPGTAGRYEVGGWRTSNGNRFNGSMGVIKSWNALLSDGEVAAEYGKAEAQRTANLYGVWPLLNDAADYSGNANDWTATGVDFTGAIPGVDYGAFGGSPPIIPQVMLHRRQLCY